MIRYLPMIVAGLALNGVVGLIASTVDIIWLCGMQFHTNILMHLVTPTLSC